jgi:thermitase
MRRAAPVIVVLVLFVCAASPARAADPLRRLQYGLQRVQADRAWLRARGAGVAIAIIDTGVDMLHEDLRTKLVGGHDFISNDDIAQDENGHGTHVAGVAAAATGNGMGVDAVAPDAMLMPLRVLDKAGTGVESNVAAAIDWALLHASGYKLVINMSFTDLELSGAVSSRRITDAVRRAWHAGAVVVAAVGNERLPLADYPAAGANVLAVGATDDRDHRAAFSNQGALVVAPGDRIVSTYWDPKTPGDHGLYASGSGTSMAAPFVAGVAALLLSSGLTNQQTVERIVTTADDIGAPGRDPEFGFGLVNAARALGLPDAGAQVRPAIGQAPVTAEGRFERLTAPGDAVARGPTGGARSARPDKLVPSLAAVLAAAVAYTVIRLAHGVHAERETHRSPWQL